MNPTLNQRQRGRPRLLSRLLARSLFCAAALAAPAQAQLIEQLVPEVGLPEDVILIRGTGLTGIPSAGFTALVGGFAGQQSMVMPLTVLSDTEALVTVPLFNSFAPPSAVPPGQLVGFVNLVTALPSNMASFGYLESTMGQILTQGSGGSEVGDLDPRIGFRLQFGPPVAGNLAFEVRAYGFPAGATCLLALGQPATGPFFPQFGGGDLTLFAAGPLALVPGAIPATFFGGESFVKVPIPPSAAGASVGLQWVALDFSTFSIAVSNGLAATL
jgi:hypothetical protein